MPYLEPLYAALRTRIAAIWPEVVANGIFESEHADLLPWEQMTSPYAVIAIAEMDEAEWGLSNLCYEVQVQIFYVAEVFGPSSTLRPKLESLRDDLRVSNLDFGQVLEEPSLSWAGTLPPNVVFLSKGMSHRAGQLTVKCLVGEVVTQP